MINVELEWGTTTETGNTWWDKLNWAEFQKVWPLAVEEEKPKNNYSMAGPCRVTYEEAQILASFGAKLTIKPLPGAMLTKCQDNHLWEYGTRIEGKDLIDGNAVQIAVPDMALMYIDEVCVQTDFCTDALQDMLDEGWRVLAICPPNSQRRPDYVLGRRKQKDPFDR